MAMMDNHEMAFSKPLADQIIHVVKTSVLPAGTAPGPPRTGENDLDLAMCEV
jgi:hypothetical protein